MRSVAKGVLFRILACVVLAAAASAAGADVPFPIGVTSRDIGGAAFNQYTPGVEGGSGANNIGLLVRMWGVVTHVDQAGKFFYIDDGLGRQDGSGFTGVRASYDNLLPGIVFTPPAQGDIVGVTGISSTILINSKIQPMLRPRRGEDMQVFYHP